LLSVLADCFTPAALFTVTVAPGTGLLDPSATVPLTDAMLSGRPSCCSIASANAPFTTRIPKMPAPPRAAAGPLTTQTNINVNMNPQKITLGNLTIPAPFRGINRSQLFWTLVSPLLLAPTGRRFPLRTDTTQPPDHTQFIACNEKSGSRIDLRPATTARP
jgi:hypothetical protein